MKKVLATILALVMAIGVTTMAWADDVAKIGDTGYATLDAAISAATEENNTVTLTDNVTLGASVTINKSGVDLVIDLGGKTISGSGMLFDIYSPVTFKNGTIDVTYTGNQSICVMWLNKNATLVLESSVTVNAAKSKEATGSVFAIGLWKDCDGASLTVNGKITGDNGATINGLITKSTNKVVVNGIIDVDGHALYLAGNGTTEINDGASITGDAGVEIRAGVLNVNGGIIESTGTYSVPRANGNGTTASGAALIVAEHTTNQGVTVNVNSGTIKAASDGKAVAASDPEGKGGDDVKLNVAGGNVVGDIQVEDSIEDEKPIAVSGGTFTSDVSNFVDNAPVAEKKDGNYVVGASAIVAAANADGAITIVKSNGAALEGVNSNVTVTAGENAGTVTVNGNTVTAGSSYTIPPRYYYNSTTTTTDTKADGTKGSPKTFDAGVGIYAVSALLSVTGMAYVGKKKF